MAPVVHAQSVANAIHRITHHPEVSVVCFVKTYPLNSDLSSTHGYPPCEQLGLECHASTYALDKVGIC